MDIKTIKPTLKRYIQAVSKHARVDRAFVYGSLVTKKRAHDVDMLVVSGDFASMDADERSKLLYRASVDIPCIATCFLKRGLPRSARGCEHGDCRLKFCL